MLAGFRCATFMNVSAGFVDMHISGPFEHEILYVPMNSVGHNHLVSKVKSISVQSITILSLSN